MFAGVRKKLVSANITITRCRNYFLKYFEGSFFFERSRKTGKK